MDTNSINNKNVSFEDIASSVAIDVKKADEENLQAKNNSINTDPFTETKKYLSKNDIYELFKVFQIKKEKLKCKF